MNQIDLNGQVAVITGGAQGIGFAIARRLVASGAKVSLWDMNADLLGSAKAELGDAASTVTVNITNYDAVAAAVAGVMTLMAMSYFATSLPTALVMPMTPALAAA